MEFPKTLAAAKRAKGAEWSLADALYEEVGPRGSETRFYDCQAYLAENNIDYTMAYLEDLHAAARNVPHGARAPWLTPRSAQQAGSLEAIEAAVSMKKAQAKEEGIAYTPPTSRELAKARKTVTHHAKQTGTPVQRPTRDKGRVTERPVNELRYAADVMTLGAFAGDAAKKGRMFIEKLAGYELSDEDRAGLEEELELVLDTWRAARDVLRNPLGKAAERFLESL